MAEKIKIRVFQHAALEEGEILFSEDKKEALFGKCETLFKRHFPKKEYNKEEVEAKIAQLLQTVSTEKCVNIKLEDKQMNWKHFISLVEKFYPNLVWISGRLVNDETYVLEFIPLVINEEGFPFSVNLGQSLIQQEVPGENNPIKEWEQELQFVVEDCVGDSEEKEDNSEEEEELPEIKKEEFFALKAKKEEKSTERKLEEENKALQSKTRSLEHANRKMSEQIENLKSLIKDEKPIMSVTNELNKQTLYYEEALRREKDAKERIKLAKEKLEHEVSRLERQIMESSLDILEGELPYVDRKKDWHKRKHIDLMEYDQLYQKAKYLEHTWQVNQKLIVISEKMTIGESEMIYERERVNQIKNSSKDIELFVMMDECRTINDRVKIKKGFLWMKPRVAILNGDYENLMEKAAYFDVIQSENQLLERIIEDHTDNKKKKMAEKIKTSR